MRSTGRIANVFFLSDYGTQDEFVGVVHAVLAASSPGVTVVDLTHHIPAFDVRAGSRALVRASPHLGPGVVLAVVDPGVGSQRRGLCVAVTPAQQRPGFFRRPGQRSAHRRGRTGRRGADRTCLRPASTERRGGARLNLRRPRPLRPGGGRSLCRAGARGVG
jgi:hypothetical protein